MNCEVVVVGGGIGGLTVAALLAKRGVDVCLFERASVAGGCAASFEKFGYRFEQGYGLYAGWEPGGIHDSVFSELRIDPPEVRPLKPGYQVRLPDNAELLLGDSGEFESQLRLVFPECADAATEFYRKLNSVGTALRNALQKTPELLSASRPARAYALLREGRIASDILHANHSTAAYLTNTSHRFRRFVDVQLQAFAQASSDAVPYLQAALVLNQTQGGMFAIRGGSAALATRLAESIKNSGGRIRLDSPVLRLAYDSGAEAVGIDLLSGETVTASKAIVSNLTIWDTYGKLVGLNRTPGEIRKKLNSLRGWGAYLIYLGLDEDVAQSLASSHILALTGWQEEQAFDPEDTQFLFSAAPSWDAGAPQGKRAATMHAFTNVDDWFTFHRDESELEEKDQQMLEACWNRLHAGMPELGDGIEVIDTATPLSFYEMTRRKLGMVGGLIPTSESFWLATQEYKTALPNLFIVSDTTSRTGVAEVTRAALQLANKLTSR